MTKSEISRSRSEEHMYVRNTDLQEITTFCTISIDVFYNYVTSMYIKYNMVLKNLDRFMIILCLVS